MSAPTSNPRSSTTPNLSLNRQTVLDEDEYTDGISRIIARDFFPTLNHLTAANDYLSALESQDPSRINDTVRTWRELGPTPVVRSGQMETPLRTPARNPSQTGSNKRRKVEDDMSLDEYQARFTSEDNASFTEILDDENRRRREKFKWAWEAQRKVMEGKMIEGANRERMLLEGGGESDRRGVGVRPGVRERIAIEKPDVLMITQGDSQSEETEKEDEDASKAMVLTTSTPARDVMAPVVDSRTPFVSTWNFKARNGLMFGPDADESPYHPPPATATPSDFTQSEGVVKPKAISYSSTRLPSPPPEPANHVPPSPTRSRIDAAIAGLPYKPSGEDGDEAAAGPNGYNYVPTLPSPSPDQLGPAALKELMTMGSLLATPRLLSSTRSGDDDDVPNPEATPFRINPPSRREQTGLRLSMKAGRSIREKAALMNGGSRTPRTRGDMAPPGATPRRGVGDLTPAARALLARSTGGKGSSTPLRGSSGGLFDKEREGSGMERDLRKVKWTPSPMTRR